MSGADPHLRERAKRAAQIVANPATFKVCEGCDSIVGRHITLCPNCYGYRFEEDPDTIVLHAQALAKRAQTTVTLEDIQ